MTDKTTDDFDGALPADADAARSEAWAEHQRRCADNEPYADGVTVEALAERVEGLRHRHSPPLRRRSVLSRRGHVDFGQGPYGAGPPVLCRLHSCRDP